MGRKKKSYDKLVFDLCFSQWYNGELSFETARERLRLKPTHLSRLFANEIDRLGLEPRKNQRQRKMNNG